MLGGFLDGEAQAGPVRTNAASLFRAIERAKKIVHVGRGIAAAVVGDLIFIFNEQYTNTSTTRERVAQSRFREPLAGASS